MSDFYERMKASRERVSKKLEGQKSSSDYEAFKSRMQASRNRVTANKKREYANEETLAQDYENAISRAQTVYENWTPRSEIKAAKNQLLGVKDRTQALSEAHDLTYDKKKTMDALAAVDSLTNFKANPLDKALAQTAKNSVRRSNDLKHSARALGYMASSMDGMEQYYGQYKNKDEYDTAKKTQDIKDKYSGLTYAQSREAYAKETDKEAMRYLDNYGINAGYSNLADYDAEIKAMEDEINTTKNNGRRMYLKRQKSRLEAKRNKFKQDNAGYGYNYLTKATDFEEKSKDRYTKAELQAMFETDSPIVMARRGYAGSYEYAYMMTEDEKGILSYLITRDKEDGTQRADKYLDALSSTLSARDTEETRKAIQKTVDGSVLGGIAGTIGSVAINAFSAVPAAIESIGNTVFGTNHDSYNKVYDIGQMLREEVGNNIEEDAGGVTRFLYDTGLSIADSAVGMLMGKELGSVGENIHLGIMGASAANSRMKELEEQGASNNQVLIGGALTGIAEALFEKVSLDKLLSEKSVATVGDKVKAVFTQMLTEGSEEVNTELANFFTDQIVRGSMSDYQQSIREYIAQGYTRDEAKKLAEQDFIKQVALAGIGGALSGGLMGGVDVAMRSSDLKKTGARLNEKQGAKEDLAEIAKSMPKTTESYQKAQSLREGLSKTANDIETAELYETVVKDVTDKLSEMDNFPERKTFEEYASEMPEGAKKKAFEANYKKGMNADAYYNRFDLIYTMGVKGYDADSVMKYKGDLSADAVTSIYAAGVISNRANLNVSQKQIDEITSKYFKDGETHGTFTLDDNVKELMKTNKLSETQKSSVKFLEKLSKVLGVNIRIYASEKDADGRYGAEQGFYDTSTNTINIDVYAGVSALSNGTMTNDTIINVAAHELTHWAEDKSPKLYAELKGIVLESMAKANGVTQQQYIQGKASELKDIYKNAGIKMDAGTDWEALAISETVAEACDSMLTSKKVAGQYLAKMSQTQKVTFAQKVKQYIDKVRAWVKELLPKYKDSSSHEAKALRNIDEAYAKAQKIWANMIEEASRVNNAMEEAGVEAKTKNTLFAIRKEFFSEFDEWAKYDLPKMYNRAVNDANYLNTLKNTRTGKRFWLGTTSDIMQGLGASEADVYMTEAKIVVDLVEHPELSIEDFKKIPRILESPAIIFKSKNIGRKGKVNDRIVVFGNAKSSEVGYTPAPLAVAFSLGDYGRYNIYFEGAQKVVSVYPKTTKIKEFFEKSEVVYTDEKKATRLMESIGFRAPIVSVNSGFVGEIIPNANGTVNIKGEKFDDVFRGKNGNVLRSIRKDSEGNTLSEQQAEFFKDSKIRDNNGNLKPMYHGTRDFGFTVFDSKKARSSGQYGNGFYFDSEGHAAHYGQRYKVYLNIVNPLEAGTHTLTTDQVKKLVTAIANNEDYGIDNYGQYATVDSVANSLKGKSDFAILNDINITCVGNMTELLKYANKVIGTSYDGIVAPTETVAFYPNQIKNVDNTNPTSNPDIRYSLRDYEQSTYDLVGENKRLQSENKKLQKDLDNLKALVKFDKTLTHGSVLKEDSLKRAAKGLIEKTGINYDANELVEKLRSLYGILLDRDGVDQDAYYLNLSDLARELAGHVKGFDESATENKEIIDRIRNTKIRISEEQKQKAIYHYGSARELQRATFGKMKVSTKEGISLDSFYTELQETYPWIVPEVTDVKQLFELADLYDDMRQSMSEVKEYYSAEAERFLASEIHNQFWQIPTVKTTADRHEQKLNNLRMHHHTVMEEMRENHKATVAEYKAKGKAYRDKISNIIKSKNERIAEAQRLGRERMDAYKDRQNRLAEIRKITDRAKTLNTWLVKNSVKEHVPDALKAPVIQLLKAIDFSSERLLGLRGGDKAGQPTQRDISLYDTFDAVRRMFAKSNSTDIADDTKEYLGGFIDLPQGYITLMDEMSARIKEIQDAIGDSSYVLNEMTYEELKTFREMVTVIKNAVTKTNKLLANAAYTNAFNAAQDTMVDVDKYGDKGKEPNAISKFLNWSNALPIDVFDRFGRGGKAIFKELQDGWDKFAFNIKKVVEFSEKAYTKKEVKEWSKEVHEYTTANGVDIKITTPQLMSLYCLSMREQADLHIKKGGIVVETFKDGKKAVTQVKPAMLSSTDIDNLIGLLSERQIEVAQTLQEFMATTCSDWGNEVSLIRHGIKLFGEENYFPIESDENYTNGEPKDKENSIFRLANMGFTKSLTKNANNPIMVKDIFDVFAKHSSDMAKYNALVLPTLDAYKWYSYQEKQPITDGEGNALKDEEGNVQTERVSVKQSLDRTFGKVAKEYVTTFLQDLNGDNSGGREEGWQNKLMSMYKVSAVAFNLRVALLQPTSYFRASAILNASDLAYGMRHAGGNAEAMKYSGIANWKDLGFYDTHVQKNVQSLIKRDDTFADKVADLGMKGAEIGDKLTWGHLWYACEHAVARENKALNKNSEEFKKATEEKFRDVIYRTQVADSTMTRSQYMRSKSGLVKLVTAFMSEPTVSFNLLSSKANEFMLAKKQSNTSTALKLVGKDIAKTSIAYLTTALANALAEAVIDAWRYPESEDEDATFGERYTESFKNKLFENFIEDMSVINKVPIFKDVYETLKVADLEAWVVNEKRKGNEVTAEDIKNKYKKLISSYYSNTRMDEAVLESARKTIATLTKIMDGDSAQLYSTVYNMAQAISQISGIPIAPIWREFSTLWNNTIGEAYPSMNLKNVKIKRDK